MVVERLNSSQRLLDLEGKAVYNSYTFISVAVDGDTVVISANGEDSNSSADGADDTAPDSGAVYVWR